MTYHLHNCLGRTTTKPPYVNLHVTFNHASGRLADSHSSNLLVNAANVSGFES